MRRFLRYAWGIVARPRATIDQLAAERSVGWAVGVAALGVLQVWGNMALFAAFGFDWLGTAPLTDEPTALGGFLLADPAYVGGFGYLRIPVGDWLPVFAVLLPALALLQLVVAPGTAQLLSKPWGGQGRFEQMVNLLTFATVPSLVVGWLSEWLTGVPLNLLFGHPYWYVAALQGEFGTTLAKVWMAYSTAVYAVPWVWGIALGSLAIRRVQRIPGWAPVATMLVAFALELLIETTFVRRAGRAPYLESRKESVMSASIDAAWDREAGATPAGGSVVLDRDRVARHVLTKQHLAPGTAATDLLRVADDLVGLHGTSPTGPYLSLLARMQSLARADLERELYERRSLIRVKAMRGTVFLFTHALAPIAYAATRSLALGRGRQYLGLDPAAYAELAPRVLQALAGRALTTAEVRQELGGDGDLAAAVSLLCDEGRLVRDRPTGSWRSTTFRYRVWQEVLPDVDLAAYEEEEASRLLVHCYLTAYGPATLSDVAWWTGLGATRARQAVQALSDTVVEVAMDGLPYRFLMARDDLAALHAAPPARDPCVALLPELDPLTMGYKERDRYLDPRHRELVFDRGGNATSVVLVEGVVAGVWDVTERPAPAARVLLFDPSDAQREAILDRAAAVAAFWFGEPVPVTEYATMVPLTQRSGVMRKPLDGAEPRGRAAADPADLTGRHP